MKPFKIIIEQNQKNSIVNGTLFIDSILESAYYNQVNQNLEEAYCTLMDALLEYSQTLAKYESQKEKIKTINNQINISCKKTNQNNQLIQNIKQIGEKIMNLSSSDINSNAKYQEIKKLTKQLTTLNQAIARNDDYIDNAPTEYIRVNAEKEAHQTKNKLEEILGLIQRIINNYLSQNQKPLISGYSGIIRTDITNNLPKESLYKRVQLSNLVVAYADLMESLCPKLINIGNSIINHQKGMYNELPYEEAKMLNIINTLSYEYLSYLHRAILTFKTNNFSIDGELENKIMLLEIAKEYMKNGHFDEEKVKLTSIYYNKRFGITPQVACDIYTLSRAKKGN